MENLKFVTGVERTLIENLNGSMLLSICSISIPECAWEKIQIKVPAQLSITNKEEDKVNIFTAKLTFLTCEELTENKHYAYRVKLLDGSYRLIGTSERPYAVLTKTENMPDKMTDNQLNEFAITYSSNKNIPKIANV